MNVIKLTILVALLSGLPKLGVASDDAIQKDLSLWLGIEPFGSEYRYHSDRMAQAFSEFNGYFTALDHWRRDIYRPLAEQKNWQTFREDIQTYDADEFIALNRSYKQNSPSGNHIPFVGAWHDAGGEPRFEFSMQAHQGTALQPRLGAITGRFDFTDGTLKPSNTVNHFNAELYLDSILFSEFLEGIESINGLFDRNKLKEISSDAPLTSALPEHYSPFEQQLFKEFMIAIPSIMKTLLAISELERLATLEETANGKRVTSITHQQKIDLSALKQAFPDTYRDFRTLLKSISFNTKLMIGETQFGAFRYDAEDQRFFADFVLHNGGFVLQNSEGELLDDIIYPTELEKLDYQVRNEISVSLFGLDVHISELDVQAQYIAQTAKSDQNDYQIAMSMATPPAVEVKGALLYILPSWLIDLLIPGTLETLIADAFEDVVTGNNGQGFEVRFDFNERQGKHIVAIAASAEMPYELLQAILKVEKKERTDKPRLYNTLRQSIRQDFRSFAAKIID